MNNPSTNNPSTNKLSLNKPEEVIEKQQALVPAEDTRAERANYIIGRYALFGTGAGILPYAGLNIAALTGVQTRMIQELANLYQVEHSQSTIRLVVQNVITSIGTRFVVGGFTRLIQSFGPLKYILGGVSSAALSGALTAEIGQLYKQHFQGGGTLADITLGQIIEHIKVQVESGEFNPGSFGGIRGRVKYLRSQN